MEELRFNSVFDIIGPVTIGPSGSHTAGAVRIGKAVRSTFGQQPGSADIYLYEPFVRTYRGHGTDIVLVGGLLGMEPDDEQLVNSLEIAYEQRMEVCFIPKSEEADHPSSAKIVASSGDRKLSATGISIGGGNIQIPELNDFKLSLSTGTPTSIVVYQDVPGMIAKVTNILPASDINISTTAVTRESRGGKAIMTIEVNQAEVGDIVMQLAEIPHIYSANYFDQMSVKE